MSTRPGYGRGSGRRGLGGQGVLCVPGGGGGALVGALVGARQGGPSLADGRSGAGTATIGTACSGAPVQRDQRARIPCRPPASCAGHPAPGAGRPRAVVVAHPRCPPTLARWQPASREDRRRPNAPSGSAQHEGPPTSMVDGPSYRAGAGPAVRSPARRAGSAPPCGLRQAAVGAVNSASMVIFTSSPTRTPPASRAAFQVSPKSLREILVVAVKPARYWPKGSVAAPS
jgi:hypothetical protein